MDTDCGVNLPKERDVVSETQSMCTVIIFISTGRDDRPRGGGRRTDYGVIVTNLPRGCSWQDLKDFMRKVGDVVYADVDRYGEGVVEFANRDDMDHAIKSLDDTEFKRHNESSFIRVKPSRKRDRSEEDREKHDRDRGRRDRSRTPSRSRERNHSPSRSESGDRHNRKRDNDREDEISRVDGGNDEN